MAAVFLVNRFQLDGLMVAGWVCKACGRGGNKCDQKRSFLGSGLGFKYRQVG